MTEIAEDTRKEPCFLIGQIESVLKDESHYKTDKARLEKIQKMMQEYYKLRGWKW
jgi:hypothetical protein